ncbi:MAG: GGDEF domain-containing protein [Candidatus Thiodiazotropha taylori]
MAKDRAKQSVDLLSALESSLEEFLVNIDPPANQMEEISRLKSLLARTQNALSEQQSAFSVIFENSPYISVIVDQQKRVRDINRVGMTFAGRDKETLLNLLGGEVFSCLNASKDKGCGTNKECRRCPVRTRVNHTFRTGEKIFDGEGQLTFVRDNQQIDLNILVSTTPIKFENEDMVLVTIIDATEQKNTEKKLVASNSSLHGYIFEIEKLEEQLREQAVRDPLTKLYNRRYLHESFTRELARTSRNDSFLSLLLIDIDHFKKINDDHGHLAGDFVLQTLGGILIDMIRTEDYPIRYGGEEFMLLLPGVSLKKARERGEALRQSVDAYNFRYENIKLNVTISIGVSCTTEDGNTLSDLINRADTALYEAKSHGRNRVI